MASFLTNYIPALVFYCCYKKSSQTWGFNGNLLLYSSVGHKSDTNLIGLKSRFQQGYVPLGGSREEPAFFPFPAFRGNPYFLAFGLLPLSSKPSVLHLSDPNSHSRISLSDSPLLPFFFTYKDPCDDIGPT